MLKYMLAGLPLLILSSTVQAIPLTGYNTVETHCTSIYDAPTDPIAHPGMAPSPHLHSHYGILADQNVNTKPIGDTAQLPATQNHNGLIQNIPGGGPSTILDPGYVPIGASCPTYGDWAWYAIPTPMTNGVFGNESRYWTWWNSYPVGDPANRTVSAGAFTWAAPKGVPVYEDPFGMTAIVGNANATTIAQQDTKHVYWTCGQLNDPNASPQPHDCTSTSSMSSTSTPAFVSVNVILVGGVYVLGTGGPQLKSGGAPITTDFYGWTPVAAEQIASGYYVGWKNGGGLYTVWNVDNNGNGLSGAIGQVPATDVSLIPFEQLFNQDFNGDGVIGTSPPPPPPPPPPSQSSDYRPEFANTGLVTGVLVFPNCWDGLNGYPNFDVQAGIGRTHFYYSTPDTIPPTPGTCILPSNAAPGAKPGIMITQLIAAYHFGDLRTAGVMVNPFNQDGPNGTNGTYALSFASDLVAGVTGGITFHSDYLNIWDINLGILTTGCLNHQNYYGSGTTPAPGNPPPGYSPLNTDGKIPCNFGGPIPRCPSPPSSPGAKDGGIFICRDQD